MPELVFYIDVAAGETAMAEETLRRIKDASGVAKADVRVEETVRSLGGLDIAAITLTLTALGGAAGATSLLLDKVRDLVKSIRGLHQVLVETPEGPKSLDSVRAADIDKH
ncbi:MAG TPA: hypothetical protein VJP02_05590 [Candidatus Sulfotelmatobacter sp.]|nr:hypothetical protein [Candidatus Sulfotelmatobacter sp.]